MQALNMNLDGSTVFNDSNTITYRIILRKIVDLTTGRKGNKVSKSKYQL